MIHNSINRLTFLNLPVMDIEFFSDVGVSSTISEDSNSFVVFGLNNNKQNEAYIRLTSQTANEPLSYRFNISQESVNVYFQDNSVQNIRLDLRVYKYPLKYMWISWYDKVLRMGRGTVVGNGIIMATNIAQIPNFNQFHTINFYSKGKAKWRFSNYYG